MTKLLKLLARELLDDYMFVRCLLLANLLMLKEQLLRQATYKNANQATKVTGCVGVVPVEALCLHSCIAEQGH